MNRRYTVEHYLGLIEKLRAVNPDVALSTDIIVGFPEKPKKISSRLMTWLNRWAIARRSRSYTASAKARPRLRCPTTPRAR